LSANLLHQRYSTGKTRRKEERKVKRDEKPPANKKQKGMLFLLTAFEWR
jgi:hypothetical protein